MTTFTEGFLHKQRS